MSRKKTLRTVAAAALACCALMGTAAADCIGGATTTTAVNLRAGAGTDNAILLTAAAGTDVIVESAPVDGWYRVYASGQWGYMSADYLTTAETLDVSAAGRVSGTEVRMRAGASTDSAIVRVTTIGESVEITGVAGEWYRVNAGGVSGYIRSDYVELGAASNQPETPAAEEETAPAQEALVADGTLGGRIVAFAKQYLGVPYVWAGASPSGFDCSGFVSYVFKSFGYSTMRTAEDIYCNNGSSVSRENLQPGDAVFFASSSQAIGHTGIYIGGGQFIHASSGSGRVIISSLSETYYANMYVGAKRIAV